MKARNIQRLESAADRMQKVMDLIDVVLEQECDNIKNSDYYFLRDISTKMFNDINMIRLIAKVEREDLRV